MSKRAKKRDKKPQVEKHEAASVASTASSGGPKSSASNFSRRKIWAFRLVAAVGMPLLLFAVCEVALRIVGFGYPTSFFLEREQDGKTVLIQNDQFGWRFFGPKLSRSPSSIALTKDKRTDTIRVFVFGESAAYGDPQPDFGLPRMLQVMLGMRHPERRFEVVNAAMTGINSHVVRKIAEDCAAADGDIWVVYMGNNEVVGPFGAGTVFGTPTPPLPVIHATMALKSTRTGQLMEKIVPRWGSSSAEAKNWGGMQAFLDNKVHQADSRMNRVYEHLEDNLRSILATAEKNNIGVVVSTVAVNLKDCGPFASETSPGLPAAKLVEWRQLFEQAAKAQQAGQTSEARAAFEKASKVDDEYADMHFLWGQALLETGELEDARSELQKACDKDLLRFRCDSRMNSVIREVARGRETERIRFVDSEAQLREQSTPPVSGDEFFYEHVHLTFAGNYRLARLLAEQVEPLLPEEGAKNSLTTPNWPTPDQCADRLAWSKSSMRIGLSEIYGRLNEPPFTSQTNHREQIEKLARQLAELTDANQTAELKFAVEQCRQATIAAPEDHVLFSQLALLLGQTGDLDGAYAAARRASELLPHSAAKMFQVGIILAMQKRDKEAVEAFQKCLAVDDQNLWARQELAKTLFRLDRKVEAIRELRSAAGINPSFGPAYMMMGIIYETEGRTRQADENFRKALEHRVRQVSELAAIGKIAQRKGWYEEAVNSYQDAIRLAPSDVTFHLALAQCLDALKRFKDAEPHYIRLTALAPNSAEARYQFGVHWAKREDHARAAEQFELATRMKPDYVAARIDLAMALIALERIRDALEQFNEVLSLEPTNATATEYKALIEKELGMQPN